MRYRIRLRYRLIAFVRGGEAVIMLCDYGCLHQGWFLN